MTEITIQGLKFEAPPERYRAGHICTQFECNALTFMLHERLRANFGDRVKKFKDYWAGREESQEYQEALENFKLEFNAYSESYQLGAGVIDDPVLIEAKKIAREALRVRYNKEGKRLEDLPSHEIESEILKIARSDEVQQFARKKLSILTEVVLDNMEDILSGQ
jgi:hypothetical protein